MPKNSLIIDDIDEFEECDDDLEVSTNVTSNSLRASTGSTGNVLVPELYRWAESSTTGEKSAWITLSQYLTGTSVTSSNWKTTLTEYAASSPNASDFRAVTYGTEKTAGQDVRVTFGGYTWYVMYLSLNSDGKAVLTLWLDNYAQDTAGREGLHDDFVWYWDNGYLFCDLSDMCMSADKEDLEGTDLDVNNLASYSGLRLNGFSPFFYVAGTGSASKFLTYAPFTNRCIAPYYMPWQEYESAKEILGLPYDLPNEAWSVSLPDENFYSPDYNYSKYAYTEYNCQFWATPMSTPSHPYTKLFIPSLSEIGYSGVSGLWGASTEQRSCNLGGEIGSYTYDNGHEYKMSGTTWTRSGNYKQSYGYYFIKNSGDGKGVGATYLRVLRPCVHLMLPVTLTTS